MLRQLKDVQSFKINIKWPHIIKTHNLMIAEEKFKFD